MTEKLRISRAKIQLRLSKDLDTDIGEATCHKCSSCEYQLDEKASENFDNLSDLEDSVKAEKKQSLVYIAGYIFRRSPESEEDTYLYYERSTATQWTISCFIMFNVVKSILCRTSLAKVSMDISLYYGLSPVPRIQCYSLANIFLKNFCLLSTPTSRKEPKQKLLKLSNV